MSATGPEEERGIEELLRINAELAAELRRRQDPAPVPTGGAAPSARRLSRLVAERDSLAAEIETAQAELAELRASEAELRRQAEAQSHRADLLESEIARLGSGFRGLGRRLRARLLRRPRG